ncbi:MAG: hypothetical protein KPI85_00895 [cyanobacterium endosymbiont of Epithemia adnata isolate EadnSB Bon19]
MNASLWLNIFLLTADHIIKLIVNKFVDEYEEKIHPIEVDIEINPKIFQNSQVMGTTTVKSFKDQESLEYIDKIKQK